MTALLNELETDIIGTGKYRNAEPQVETYGYMAPVQIPTPTNRPMALFSFTTLDGEVKRLRTPLLLRLTVEEGEVFVENDSLNIFGHGRTLQAAIAAFSRDVAYFWAYYRALRPDEVAGDGAALKKLYEELAA
jgi:hypothetical protein